MRRFALLAVAVALGLLLTSSPARADPNEAVPDSACKVTEDHNGGIMICPASVPIPPDIASPHAVPVNVEAPVSARGSQIASYWCDWGERCYALAAMTPGVEYTDWYGVYRITWNHYLVAHYVGQCTDPAGCWFMTWWQPPNTNWAGLYVDIYSDAYVSILSCWCASGQHHCTID